MNSHARTTVPATNQLTTLPTTKRERERLKKLYPGALYAVAIRLSADTSFVSRVFRGMSSSAKMYQAILDEFNRRIENEHKAAASKGNGL